MAVKTTASPKAQDAAKAESSEATQSIALVLNKKIKRYVRVADNKLYEAGVVYQFAPDKAAEVSQDTDERGYPIFVPYKPVAKVERMLVSSTGLKEEVVTAPVRPVVASPNAIVIPDDDPELEARLSAIDSGDTGTEGAVSV